jgi:hypothetical protein
MALIELAKRPRGSGWTPERREWLFQQVLARAEVERAQRRVRLAFAAGACTALVVGAVLWLISIPEPDMARAAPELTGKPAIQQVARE